MKTKRELNNHPFLGKLMSEPIGILEERFGDLLFSLEQSLHKEFQGVVQNNKAEDDDRVINRPFKVGADYMGAPLPKTKLVNNVAVVPLKGSIVKGGGNLSRYLGMAELDDFAENMEAALAMDEAEGIMLHVASPGGFTTGVPEAARAVVAAGTKKPIMAYTDSMMASAAYYIAAGAHELAASSSAVVGSVGTYMVVIDASEFLKEVGISVEIIKSGKFKGTGHPAKSLSKEQRTYLQKRVDENGEDFRQFVMERRTLIDRADLEGQAYFGKEAALKGFVHFNIDTPAQAIERFSQKLGK
jgi:signal peptide peptidase SppA